MQKNMENWRGDADPMDMLQAFVSALAGYYDEEFSNKDASYEKAINLLQKFQLSLQVGIESEMV